MGQTFLLLALQQLFIVALMVLGAQRSKARQTAAPVCETLGSRGTKLLPSMCKGLPPLLPPKTLQHSTISSQTMKEF